jgi:replicative DNA helicase
MGQCIEQQLVAEAFYQPAHQMLFEALHSLHSRNLPIDEIVLLEELRTRGILEQIGGPAYLAELTNRIRSTLFLEHYIGIVREKYLLRRLISTCAKTVEECFRQQTGVMEFIENVEQEIFKIGEGRPDSTRGMREIVKEAQGVINSLIERKKQVQGLPTGFRDLDRMTFGFHPGDMIVLAARPSMGKTSLALNFAEAAALPSGAGLKPAHTLVFSLEMTAQSLAMRLICARAGVDMQQLREGTVRKAETLDAITKTASEFLKAPIKINDSSGLSITEIRAIARRIHQREPLQLIVIDYLQLVKGSSRTDNREQEVSEISRGVKALAKELQVPVIVLSQLNRATEKDNRQPRLSDLRESGAIEQDADVVLLISHVEGAKDEDKMQPQITVDLIIAKQRNGQVGKIPLQFKKSITRFFETSYAG